MIDVIIIGAGISGLVAARDLAAEGWNVIVLEKSRSIGGRCATRIWNGHVVDHGAQFITLHSETIRLDMLKIAQNKIHEIQAPVWDSEHKEIIATGGARYYHVEGNNRIGAALAFGLDVRREVEVDHLSCHNGLWRVGEMDARCVLLTCPLPQQQKLLGLPVNHGVYLPCLTGLFEFEGSSDVALPQNYAINLKHTGQPIEWSACENHKSGRVQPGRLVLVAQAGESFSNDFLESPHEIWLAQMEESLRSLWPLSGVKTMDRWGHRWRYARREATTDVLPMNAGCFVAGDSLVRSRIEDVWMDGQRAAKQIADYLTAQTC